MLVGDRAITRKIRLAGHHAGELDLRRGIQFAAGDEYPRAERLGYRSSRSGAHPLRQHGYFSIGAAVRNDVVGATLKEIFYEIDLMRSTPVGEEELADARNYLSGVFSWVLRRRMAWLGSLRLRHLKDCRKIISKHIASAS